MPNMSMTKNPMPAQEPDVRNKNFLEVALGYTEEMAIDEAQRCLNCKHKPSCTDRYTEICQFRSRRRVRKSIRSYS